MKSVPELLPNAIEHRRQLAKSVNLALRGKLDASASVTLTVSSATTTFKDPRIGYSSILLFMPTTANAAAGIAALYVTDRQAGQATLNHANNTQADRTYAVLIIG